MAKRRRKRKSDESKKAAPDKPSQPDSSRKHSSSRKQSSSENVAAETPSTETSSPPGSDLSGGERNRVAILPTLPSLSRIMSVVMLMIGILVVGALFYRVMAAFFVPLFLAALLVVIFRPVHQWIYFRVGNKKRVAALATTALILMIVLLPVTVVLSVAATQFTAMISHVNFNDLTAALDRARAQLSISLPNAAQFRRLGVLADSFDDPDTPDEVISNIAEAKSLVLFLQQQADYPAAAEPACAIAEQRLDEFTEAVLGRANGEPLLDVISELDAEEQFHRQSVSASAAIRSWMRILLGGTLRSQAKLLANPSEADFAKLLRTGREALQPRFVQVTSATGAYVLRVAASLLILVVAVYFFLLDGAAMIRTLMRLSPMDDAYERRLLMEFDRTSRAVALASVASALVQGLLAAIGFWFFGFDTVILLFLLTTMMSLVPFLGAASVWVPCALWLGAVEQRWGAALLLAIYGAALVSSIDNVIKMYVLHGRSTLHPLFALLSVFGGLKVFGPIGVLVGPMVVVFLQTLLEILNHELVSTETDESQNAKKMDQDAPPQPA